jgi:hypothetical protein
LYLFTEPRSFQLGDQTFPDNLEQAVIPCLIQRMRFRFSQATEEFCALRTQTVNLAPWVFNSVDGVARIFVRAPSVCVPGGDVWSTGNRICSKWPSGFVLNYFDFELTCFDWVEIAFFLLFQLSFVLIDGIV